jgi:hypothetical protein
LDLSIDCRRLKIGNHADCLNLSARSITNSTGFACRKAVYSDGYPNIIHGAPCAEKFSILHDVISGPEVIDSLRPNQTGICCRVPIYSASNLYQEIFVTNLLKIAIAGLIVASAQPLYAQTGVIPVSITWTKNQAGKHQWNVPVEFRLFDSTNKQIAKATLYSKSGGAVHKFQVPVNAGRGSSVATTVYYVKAASHCRTGGPLFSGSTAKVGMFIMTACPPAGGLLRKSPSRRTSSGWSGDTT